MNAIASIKPQPLYCEAREYCDRHGIESLADFERVRKYLCHREFQRRMEPWNKTLAKLHPAMYSVRRDAPLPPSYVALQEQVRQVAEQIAADLDLTLAPSSDGSS